MTDNDALDNAPPGPRDDGPTAGDGTFYGHLSDWYWAKFLASAGRPVPVALLLGTTCDDAVSYARRESGPQTPAT